MKFSTVLAALVSVASALPSAEIVKRASANDKCPMGYCTMNGGTSGGSGGPTVKVSNLSDLKSAVAASGKSIVHITSSISGSESISVASDKTIIGSNGVTLTGIGLSLTKVSNVIIRNLKITKVSEGQGDAIGLETSTNVWIDHCDLSSDMDHGKDYYDGLIDMKRGSDWITISNVYIHDHYKASLVGHSDKNAAQDEGKLHVTYEAVYWKEVYSRGPSVRFGQVHLVNCYWEYCSGAVNTRMGAKILLESSKFTVAEAGRGKATEASSSNTPGIVAVKDVDFGGARAEAPSGSFSVPYGYSTVGSGNAANHAKSNAGQKLSF